MLIIYNFSFDFEINQYNEISEKYWLKKKKPNYKKFSLVWHFKLPKERFKEIQEK